MLTKDFNYSLPEDLIAQQPTAERAQSRLLVVPQKYSFIDMHIQSFSEALELIALKRGKSGKVPLVVLNESKVYPARVMISKKSGAKGEVFILNEAVLGSGSRCEVRRAVPITALLRPLKKMRLGDVLYDTMGKEPLFEIVHLGTETAGLRLLKPLNEIFSCYAEMPTPPYIKRQLRQESSSDFGQCESDELKRLDFRRYQNVYASTIGSAAAPTAGLHFSEQFLSELVERRHAEFAKITLHVGIGTFRPVQTESPALHEMHSEYYSVSQEALKQLEQAQLAGRPIVFLGTTSFRAVESFFLRARESFDSALNLQSVFESARKLCNGLLETNLFVYPKNSNEALYRPVLGDALFTNFHQPQSTLLMLVSALAGFKLTMAAYEHAIEQRYRFLSYGDASIFEFAQKSCLDN